ncbi:FAD:protein FMN transferase [Massilia sp. PAMC28688]|uniref:FAD:protein FMN transferase n=1 Tax=Massilia sp. PAMC28688 TaxID=2861283 RepID=UPI001C6281AB|nr:FAD:protein FMN transferase [Massilia sp. PAMC28688]QYF92276.1 FAD:protein FMN transferase [Massilia sp. PAMC28688]
MRRVLVPLSIAPELPAPGSAVAQASGYTMGTTWQVQAVLAPAQAGLRESMAQQLQRQLDIIVAQMSHWESGSDLGRFNAAPAGSWHHLPSAFYKVLSYALEVADASGGAYDPCAGALVNCWGFGAQRRYTEAGFYAPPADIVHAILAREDRARLKLDPAGRQALQPGGVQLDLSSVAKGYGVDQLANCLELNGVHHYLVEVGGELRGAGVKPDGGPWWVQLEAVPDAGQQLDTVAALHGLAIATSGDYRQHFSYAGARASHTLDPRTGYPIRNQVASVTVLHAECMAADALSTALSVLGPEAGLRFAEARKLAARFIVRTDGGLHEVTSSAFDDMLQ